MWGEKPKGRSCERYWGVFGGTSVRTGRIYGGSGDCVVRAVLFDPTNPGKQIAAEDILEPKLQITGRSFGELLIGTE